MKNQYFGDINDYIKYGLLRCFAEAGFGIGIIWMLTPEDGQSDGRKIRYLSPPYEWKHHDPFLFNMLSDAVLKANDRNIRHIEKNDIIPNSQFWDEVVPDDKAKRAEWDENAVSSLYRSDLFFFDPDNGIEVKSKPLGRKGSSKYIYWEELQQAWEKKKSLLVFQYFPRKKRSEYIPALATEMRKRLKGANVVPFKSLNVLFLLVYCYKDRARVRKAIQLIEKRWSLRVLVRGDNGGRPTQLT